MYGHRFRPGLSGGHWRASCHLTLTQVAAVPYQGHLKLTNTTILCLSHLALQVLKNMWRVFPLFSKKAMNVTGNKVSCFFGSCSLSYISKLYWNNKSFYAAQHLFITTYQVLNSYTISFHQNFTPWNNPASFFFTPTSPQLIIQHLSIPRSVEFL